jgi:hypothetical protein
VKKPCDKCVYEPPCVLCTYRNKIRLFGKPKPLKFNCFERKEIDAMKKRDWHIKYE